MKIQYRYNPDPEVARSYGWSKRHRALEVFVACKWRIAGFYTERQIKLGEWKKPVSRTLAINMCKPVDTEFEFELNQA